MKISSVNEIIQGELLNSPAISFIYSAKTNLLKIQEGDIFFAKNVNDIENAILKGAFAIVVDEDVELIDNEIAWIKVDDVQKAIIRYIRFKLSQIELNSYYCNKVRFELFKTLCTKEQNFWLFSDDLNKILSKVDDIKNGDTIFCNDENIIKSIYPLTLEFKNNDFEISNLTKHSLFESSFSYKNIYFSKIKLSPLYIKEFLDVAEFFNFSFNTDRLKKLELFKPIFVDKFFNICEYGKSNKFLLVQNKKNLIKNELDFIYENYTYAKKVVISKTPINLENIEYILVENLENFIGNISNIEFNALYIIGYTHKEIEETLLNNSSLDSLI